MHLKTLLLYKDVTKTWKTESQTDFAKIKSQKHCNPYEQMGTYMYYLKHYCRFTAW